MTDPTAEATSERSRARADEDARDRAVEGGHDRAETEATTPVASMDVAPELFPTGAAGVDERQRGDR